MFEENAADKAKRDQDLAEASDSLPRLWFRLFTGMKAEGFNEAQALEVLKAFVSGRPH